MGEIPTDFTSPQVGEIKCYTVILPLFFFFSLLVVQAFDLLFREKKFAGYKRKMLWSQD